MIFVKVNNTLYPASISGLLEDRDWGNRESKTITIRIDFDELKSIFVDGVSWSIVVKNLDEDNNEIVEEFDNSEFNLAGDITDHRDGYCSIKMGKLTALEEVLMEM